MSRPISLRLLLQATLFIVAVPVFLSLGPVIEARFLPVIRVRASEPTIVGNRMQFWLVGKKYRGCRLDSYGIGWRVDHDVITVSLEDAAGNLLTIPAALQAGEVFALGAYYVKIPDPARTFRQAALKITYYYRCSLLWLTEQDLTIPLPDIAKAR